MGTLDEPTGANIKRRIKVIDITGMNKGQIENEFNVELGKSGWRFKQVFDRGSKKLMILEKEVL